VEVTLAAWRAVVGDPGRSGDFEAAAAAWHEVAVREEVRCLLAHGVYAGSAEAAVPPLLRAELLAEEAGLVVLLGRARRALRRYSVRRDTRGPRAGAELTERERDVLRLVAQGEPTRRIAGLLGISRETVETHIRSGMRKLGARTRTEAAALALEVLT
jgi:DNA-binding CsgD family transcriptional regulator